MSGRVDYAGEGRGFGHLNAYETQLVLQSVSDVSATDQASNYDRKEYSPKPIRFPTGYLRGRVVAPAGRRGVERALRSYQRRLAEHLAKLDKIKRDPGSVQREINNFRGLIQAARDWLSKNP